MSSRQRSERTTNILAFGILLGICVAVFLVGYVGTTLLANHQIDQRNQVAAAVQAKYGYSAVTPRDLPNTAPSRKNVMLSPAGTSTGARDCVVATLDTVSDVVVTCSGVELPVIGK